MQHSSGNRLRRKNMKLLITPEAKEKLKTEIDSGTVLYLFYDTKDLG